MFVHVALEIDHVNYFGQYHAAYQLKCESLSSYLNDNSAGIQVCGQILRNKPTRNSDMRQQLNKQDSSGVGQ